ncbi:MarR family transcriptional regulator [Anaerocolumna sp. AGMB13025]|uniref:MarR family transcriptional regulator n=1 Tax=Anaerocolumna sp. AGMB13025 TaxID=3039116 RepID=UPI00241DCD63|nr:MarR family transcriptional regulator [Anaerocolumna sp. AGMB13025]WFR58833.1 MarR family transcriptional regulator [Anaerocolumna sp. AGMB13025]
MSQALKILDILIKMQEYSDVYLHKQDGLLEEIGLTEVHCIDCIGKTDHPNVTKISEQMRLTRAGISKISKRLLSKGLIESYQEPDNNKEIYFKLTVSGQSVYEEHKKIHNKAQQEWLAIFDHYSTEEQATILRFLVDIEGHYDRISAVEKEK